MNYSDTFRPLGLIKIEVFVIRLFAILTFLFLGSVAHAQSSSTKICDVLNYGAKGDGTTIDTVSIQSAIDDCANAGGGTVILKSHSYANARHITFVTGTLFLKSNITFKLDATATLKGSLSQTDYPLQTPDKNGIPIYNSQSWYRTALLYVSNAKNVSIDGGGAIGSAVGATNGGMIDGSGSNPIWNVKDASQNPIPIFIVSSDQVNVQGLYINNAAISSVIALESTHVTIQNLSIHAPDSIYRDGIDIIDSSAITIKNSQIYSNDDAICMKSGDPTGVQNVNVSNIDILFTQSNGIKFGVGSIGPMNDIHFDSIRMFDVGSAAIAIESVNGSAISNVSFNNIHFDEGAGVGTPFFLILGAEIKIQNPQTFYPVGSVDQISFSNISGKTKYAWGSLVSGSSFQGSTYSITHLSFNNVSITNGGTGLVTVPPAPPEYSGQYPDAGQGWKNLPAYGIYFRHVNGVVMSNVSFHPSSSESRQTFIQSDVQNLQPSTP